MRLTATDLRFRYAGGDHDVLAGLTCAIPSGARAAIVGPSGSGKTTLMSVLGGLLRPQQGAFECVDERGGLHVPRDVSTWVLQTVSLLPDRTVLDNVALGAYLDGADVPTARRRARRRLAEVGLSGHTERPARVLSGGEGQRAAIARALASNRPVLFADEPTGQLDAATTEQVLDAMFAAADRTVILVTHDEAAASRCDFVLHLADGVLRSDAPTLPEAAG